MQLVYSSIYCVKRIFVQWTLMNTGLMELFNSQYFFSTCFIHTLKSSRKYSVCIIYLFFYNRCYRWRGGPCQEQWCQVVRPQPVTCAMVGWRFHPAACWTIQMQSGLSTTSFPASRTLKKKSITHFKTRLTSCKPSPTLPTITTPLQVRMGVSQMKAVRHYRN